jgi:acyl-CoA thioester hydrolase
MAMNYRTPIATGQQAILEEWIDANGHMNVAYYSLIFDRGLDFALETLGIGPAYVARVQRAVFVVESHVRYLRELRASDTVAVCFQLLDCDSKRIHFVEQMLDVNTCELAATSEQIGVHVDLRTRKAVAFSDDSLRRLQGLLQAHSRLGRPRFVGLGMGLSRS